MVCDVAKVKSLDILDYLYYQTGGGFCGGFCGDFSDIGLTPSWVSRSILILARLRLSMETFKITLTWTCASDLDMCSDFG